MRIDNSPSPTVGEGATVKVVAGYEEKFPSLYESQIKSPFTFNAASLCYEKKIIINPSSFADPHGVLDGLNLSIQVQDNTGQVISGASTSVKITPVP